MRAQCERPRFRLSLATILLLLVTVFLVTAANGSASATLRAGEDIKEKWGIEISSVRLAVDGYMVDFRYRVLDAKKAESLFVRKIKPYLIDQASNKVLAVPNLGKVGPLRTSNKPKEGRIYWMFFGNTRRLVESGSKVTVVIGDFRVENLSVQ